MYHYTERMVWIAVYSLIRRIKCDFTDLSVQKFRKIIFHLFFKRFWHYLFPGKAAVYHYTEKTGWIAVVTGIFFSLMSVSRVIALYQGNSINLYVKTKVMLNKLKSSI